MSKKKPSDVDRILNEIKVVSHEVRDLHHTIKAGCGDPARRSLNPYIKAIYGRRSTMANDIIPVPELLDTQKIVCSVMPRLRNGHISVNASVTWAAEGDTTVEPGVDPFPFHDIRLKDDGSVDFEEDVTCPGSFNATATTPGSSGSGKVIAAGSDAEGAFDGCEFGPINWHQGAPRKMNGSVGSPISDL